MINSIYSRLNYYRPLRWSNLTSESYRHLILLLFWPIFGILFFFVERGSITSNFHIVHCALDDIIPFCEYFLIPYLFWFIFICGIMLYSLLFDIDAFKNFMYYTIITYSITMLIYFLYPTAQQLRPVYFERNNIFTYLLGIFYELDTSTNVCPSLHVIGSVAVMHAAWNSRHFSTAAWRIVFLTATLLISISTVFLKQHSVIDVFAALPVCFLAYKAVYGEKFKAYITSMKAYGRVQ